MSFSHHESTLDMDNNSQEVRKAVTVEALQNVVVCIGRRRRVY
jgi:hypothetical protein